MSRLLPFPSISAALALVWLMLNELSPGHATLGLILAIAIPHAAAPFLAGLPRVRAPQRIVALLGRVTWDIVLANIAVARLILGAEPRLRPAFVEVPLALTHPHGITLLATIITMTPGTVSVALAPHAGGLLVHVLDVEDPARLINIIKTRYERPLQEILEC
jgi:multicomponent K+:H+ antiporter subunit E